MYVFFNIHMRDETINLNTTLNIDTQAYNYGNNYMRAHQYTHISMMMISKKFFTYGISCFLQINATLPYLAGSSPQVL